jgi:hypothetical protein
LGGSRFEASLGKLFWRPPISQITRAHGLEVRLKWERVCFASAKP